jgi:hypothetical protein
MPERGTSSAFGGNPSPGSVLNRLEPAPMVAEVGPRRSFRCLLGGFVRRNGLLTALDRCRGITIAVASFGTSRFIGATYSSGSSSARFVSLEQDDLLGAETVFQGVQERLHFVAGDLTVGIGGTPGIGVEVQSKKIPLIIDARPREVLRFGFWPWIGHPLNAARGKKATIRPRCSMRHRSCI